MHKYNLCNNLIYRIKTHSKKLFEKQTLDVCIHKRSCNYMWNIQCINKLHKHSNCRNAWKFLLNTKIT